LQKELSAQLSQAIELLPPIHQQVVRLRFYEGASLPEIAGALGLPLGTVKSRLHHALEHLRQMKYLVNLFNESEDT
jgi:RNA polymerase sigma-70 factor, ECF subfamily